MDGSGTTAGGFFSPPPAVSPAVFQPNAPVMNGKPPGLRRAWSVHDALYQDDRVRFLNEPGGIEDLFRAETASPLASPKVLADAYLLSFAACTGASSVTFDRALARRNRQCLLLS